MENTPLIESKNRDILTNLGIINLQKFCEGMKMIEKRHHSKHKKRRLSNSSNSIRKSSRIIQKNKVEASLSELKHINTGSK